jgi:hypothetical protein
MSQNLESNVWVQIEDYINQIWSFDGFLSPSINQVTHMILYTYVFCLFSFIGFSLFVIYSLIYDYITSPPPGMRDWIDKVGADLYNHIEARFPRKMNNIYQVSAFVSS